MRRPETKNIFISLFNWMSWGYLTFLFAWLAAYLLTGDSFGYMALLNLLAVNFFFPLPLVLLAAVFFRWRGLGIASAMGLLAFVWFWGIQFLPDRFPTGQPASAGSSALAESPALTVMTYNVLATHTFTQPIIATIRHENADVVFIQELNHALARALQSELGAEYPFQVFEAVDNASGIGTISKYPLRPTGEQLPHRWIGGPQILELTWNAHTITAVNFHMHSTVRVGSLSYVEQTFRTREEQAQLLLDLVRRSGSTILGGDANSVPLSDVHRILTADLQDAWRERGFGLGHTFPGSTVPGSDRPRIGPWYVPPWLARIDYILHTGDWETLQARLAMFDGVSDHRGVVAQLRFKP